MKRTDLWQKKRSELPVNGNPDAEWLQMRAMLDKQMPVPNAVKKPFRLKMPKWGLHVFAGVSLVAAVYVGSRLYFSKNHHDPEKPGKEQTHHDSVAPAAHDTLLTRDTITPATGPSTSGLPVNAGTNAVYTKLKNDTTPKNNQNPIDSLKSPAILNGIAHRDTSISPIEGAPPKVVRDSTGPLNLEKNDIQKDTLNSGKKNQKKKRRSKLSLFF